MAVEAKRVRMAVRKCPEKWADSPVGMATTFPAIHPVTMAWECPAEENRVA